MDASVSMQPSNNPLIVLGMSAVVAASAIGVSPAAAEPGLRDRQPSERREATQADASSEQTVVQQRFEVQRRTEERLDRLQTESQIRQQLNQSQFRTFDRPLAPETNSLQLDQSIQQQLNLQNLQNSGRDVGTSPSRSLDRLQFEQRVRQQIQQPRIEPLQQPEPEPEASVNQVDPAAESTEQTTQLASAEQSPPQADQAAAEQSQSAEAEIEETEASEAQQAEQPQAATTEAETEAKQAEAEAEVEQTAEQSDQEPSSEAAAEPEAVDAEKTDTEPETETAEVEPSVETEASEAETTEAETASETEETKTQSEAETTEAETASETEETETQAEATEATAEQSEEQTEAEQAEASETDSAEPTAKPSEAEATPAAESDAESETAQVEDENSDTLEETLPVPGTSEQVEFEDDILDDSPAPEYLDPDPNPLAFPTQPEEVELAGTQPITLRQAVELAIRNNPTLRQAQFELERSQADLRRNQAANFPTLDATANFSQSGNEATQRVPETTTDQAGNEVPNPAPNAGDIVRGYNDSTVLGTGLELNYSIFTSGRRPALIQAARSQVRLQQLEVERQTEQLILETIGDYYDLQQSGAQVNIFQANLAQAEQSLRDAQALERAGVGTRFDVLQAEVDVANARQRLTQQLSDLEVSRRELVQRLNLSQTVNVSAADPIEVAGVWDLSLEESIVQAFKNRVELEQQLIQREIAQKNRRAALAQLGPQLGLQGAFNLNSNIDNDAALEYSYQVALVASLALFDGGDARAQADREESNISIAEAEFENVRDQIRVDVERGYSQLNASFANIQTTALAVEQATEALRLARLRFQAGVGTQTDVLRQQSVLAEAQVNNLSAILDYNRSLAVLQRAISNYPEGFLNEVP